MLLSILAIALLIGFLMNAYSVMMQNNSGENDVRIHDKEMFLLISIFNNAIDHMFSKKQLNQDVSNIVLRCQFIENLTLIM